MHKTALLGLGACGVIYAFAGDAVTGINSSKQLRAYSGTLKYLLRLHSKN